MWAPVAVGGNPGAGGLRSAPCPEVSPNTPRATPDRPALIAPDGPATRTYGELDDRARRLAHVLRGLGAGPDRPVAAAVRNGLEPFEVAIAAAMAGAPFLPLNWHLKAAEVAYLLDDAGVGVVVGHADLADQLPTGGAGDVAILLIGGEGAYEDLIAGAPADPTLDSGAGPELVFYTSGTTARPKGVVHAGMRDPEVRHASFGGQAQLWGWSADDVYVMSGPCYHASHAWAGD